MKMYKLVSQNYKSYGGMTWEIGKTNKAKGKGNKMCTDAVLHCYSHPLLAVMFNPIHANIENPRLLEIHCSPVVATDGLKYATKTQRPVKELPLPVLSKNQRVAFAIKVALKVCKLSAFVIWANAWLDGTARSAYAAARAADATRSYAADAADAAAAAYEAAYAAARAADAAYDAADAAYAAAYAAVRSYADADAAYAAQRFVESIEWVMENIKD